MDLDSVAARLARGSRRGGQASMLAAILAALSMALAAPAQATPALAKAWGLNAQGQLGDGTFTGPEKCGAKSDIPCSTIPVFVSGLGGVTALAGGPTSFSRFSLALLEGGG